MALKYKTITKTFNRSSDYRVGPGDVADFNIDAITFPSEAIDITYFTVTFNGALRSPVATPRTVDIKLEGYSNDLWRSFYSTSIEVKGLNEENQITVSGTLDQNAREVFLSYGISDFRVENTSAWNHVEACESTNSITFTYSYNATDPPAVTVTPPTNVVVSQKDDNFIIKWDPSTVSGGSGQITYVIHEGHEDVEITDPTTNTSITIPLFYPTEAREDEGIWFVVCALYNGKEEARSERVTWNPQHVLYYYTGISPDPWQQCEIYYYDGTEFRPCEINYYNQGWLG